MVGVSASVNLPLHHKVQKFSSGTGTDSPGGPAATTTACGSGGSGGGGVSMSVSCTAPQYQFLHTCMTGPQNLREAQLPQTESATRYVS